MNRLQRRIVHNEEDGSILILALVFLSLFGLFIAALLAQTEVNFKTTTVVRGENNKLFGADGGIDIGVQALRSTDTLCASVAAGTQSVTVPVLNGRPVTVSCRTLAGATASPAAEQWSVITTGSGAGSITFNPGAGSTATANISGGDLFLNSDPTLNGTLATTQADVTRNTAACSQPANLTLGAPDLWACANGSVPTVPHVLPPVPDPRLDPQTVFCGGRNWKVLHPGKYTSAAGPDLLSHNYLESGVYYFEDVALSLNSRVLIGGQPATGETNVQSPACPNDTTTGVSSRASGRGVMIILGGTSSISFTPFSTAHEIELFTRQSVSGDTYTPGISLYVVPDNSVSGYKAFTGTTAVVDNTGAGGLAVHGLVYAPSAQVSVFARATYAPLLGGVVASKLIVNTQASSSGSLQAVSASGRRTVLLTSSAAGLEAGESATAERAVVKIANDPSRTATVRSWRTQ